MDMCEYSNDLAKRVYKSFCFVAHVVSCYREYPARMLDSPTTNVQADRG